MRNILSDIKYSVRMLLKKPGYTAASIIILTLGMGFTIAAFTVVNALLLRPLSYPESDRLLFIGQSYTTAEPPGGAGEFKFLFWREHSNSFEAMTCISHIGATNGNLITEKGAEFVRGARISKDFFRVFGVNPSLGRPFSDQEDNPGNSASVAILSDGLWKTKFGAELSVIGKSVRFNEKSLTVIGVMPPNFMPDEQLFIPLQAGGPQSDPHPNAAVIGRLKRGVTLEQAKAELKAIAESYRAQFPDNMRKQEFVDAILYRDSIVTADVTDRVWLIFGGVALLLLIGCVNVANLQLLRSSERQREIAIRTALGAEKRRIIRLLLIEGMMLAIAGGSLGLAFAMFVKHLFVNEALIAMPITYVNLSLDWRITTLAIISVIGSGLIFGLIPLRQIFKVDIANSLKENAGRGGTAKSRLKGVFVTLQVAFSIILLVGAGLFIRTFIKLSSVNSGITPDNVNTYALQLRGEQYTTANNVSAFYDATINRIKVLPGIESVAFTNVLPVSSQFNSAIFFPDSPDDFQSVQFRVVTPDYFRVFKIPVKHGRVISDEDHVSSQPVVVVSESFAKLFISGEKKNRTELHQYKDPIGRQIVGVVGDVRQLGLKESARPTVYFPTKQVSDRTMNMVSSYTKSRLVVRAKGQSQNQTSDVIRAIASIDPTIAVHDIRSMNNVLGEAKSMENFYMTLCGLLAGLGLLLSVMGIYAVTSYMVTQRTSEMALRIALGAQVRNIMSLILKHGLLLAGIGLVIGVAGAFALTRFMKGMLFGVETTDTITFLSVIALIMVASIAACLLPARRAAKADPITALRCE